MPTFESIDVFDSKKNILRFDGYFVVPVLVLSFSLAISAVLHKNEKDRIESDLTKGFIQEKNEIHKKFREKLRNYGFTLRGLRNWLVGDSSERRRFTKFIRNLDIKKEYPGVWNYYYAPLVNKKDLANHVLGMQKLGFPEYRVSSSGESEKYLPITQAYGPENVDVKLNGTDLYANSEFRASFEESVDENRVSIIWSMPLAQETDMSRDAGFTMSLATYDEGGSADTVERRRKSVSGLLGLSVRMDDFIREIVNSSQAEGISVEIYDGKVAYHAHSVFDTDTVDPGNARHYDDSKFFSMEKNEIFWHEWTIVIHSDKRFESNKTNGKDVVIAFSGIGISLLLTLLSCFLVYDRNKTLDAVQKMRELNTMLKENEFFLRESQEKWNIGSYRVDFRSGIWKSSRMLDVIFGIDERQGKTISDWIGIVHPDDREMMERYLHEEVIGRGERFRKEYRIIRQNDREIRWIYGSGELKSDIRGKPVSMVGTIADITDNKRLSEANLAIFMALQYEREQALRDTILSEQRRIEAMTIWESELENQVAMRTKELYETNALLRDTQEKLIEEAKLASLGSLVAGVAHELNTPIGNSVLTASTLEYEVKKLKESLDWGNLSKSKLAAFCENAWYAAEIIHRSCSRAGELVKSFKRISVDQASELRSSFDFRVLLDNTIVTFWPSFKWQSWKIEVDIPENIMCDSFPGPLSQVIVNIVQNTAIHAFHGRQEGTLRISAQTAWDQLEITFEDDGVGMEKEVLSHIFEPFYTTKMGQGGTWLGLSISRNIVTGLLGGVIETTSEVDRGTRTIIRIPLVAPVKTNTYTQ